MILSIFGQPGSGKTTISRLWRDHHEGWFSIDGDELRLILPNQNYSYAGRVDNINRANTIATFLNHRNHNVVMSLVNPIRWLREELHGMNPGSVVPVYLKTDRTLRQDRHYPDFEEPSVSERAVWLSTSGYSPLETLDLLMQSMPGCIEPPPDAVVPQD